MFLLRENSLITNFHQKKVDKELAWAMDTDLTCTQITIDAIVVWDCDS
jgi:hypothetical protein